MSACEAFWVKCERTARKVAIFENVFKAEQRLWLCDDHTVQFADLDFRKQLLDRALDSVGALQQQEQRIVDQAGIDRVGRYVIEHCCEVGVRLNYEVGVAMQGAA